jgi:hypothetical protein
MSRTTRPAPRRSEEPAPPPYGRTALLGIGAALVTILAVTIAGSLDGSTMPSADIGEFTTSGTATAADLRVQGAHIAMGNVPLDVTVSPTWTITNTGNETVTLGEPHASVVEGCCPGPLLLAETRLAPGEATTLTFPLQMHAGMDGPHDFEVHLPVSNDPDVVLTLRVTGDFGA